MSFALSDDDEIMSEINMTPLVDVMLVLLIIFMITVPVIQHSVKLDLPQAQNRPNDLRPPHVNIAIREDGGIHWNGIRVENAELSRRISTAASQKPQPELHLYADRHTAYEHLARVMSVAQSGGLLKIGFVTDPEKTTSP